MKAFLGVLICLAIVGVIALGFRALMLGDAETARQIACVIGIAALIGLLREIWLAERRSRHQARMAEEYRRRLG